MDLNFDSLELADLVAIKADILRTNAWHEANKKKAAENVHGEIDGRIRKNDRLFKLITAEITKRLSKHGIQIH